jgi:hypothetical protein
VADITSLEPWKYATDGALTQENLANFEALPKHKQHLVVKQLDRAALWPEGDVRALATLADFSDPLFLTLARDDLMAFQALHRVLHGGAPAEVQAKTNELLFYIACQQNATQCVGALLGDHLSLAQSFTVLAEGGLQAAKRGNAYLVGHLAGENKQLYARTSLGDRDVLASFMRHVRCDAARPPAFYHPALVMLLSYGATPASSYEEPQALNHLGWCALEDAAKIRAEGRKGAMDIWNSAAARHPAGHAWFHRWSFTPLAREFKESLPVKAAVAPLVPRH